MRTDGRDAQLRGESQRPSLVRAPSRHGRWPSHQVDLPHLAHVRLRWRSGARPVHVLRHHIGLVADRTIGRRGVPVEEIARLAGHNRTATTELVYRHELRPVITTGVEVLDRILDSPMP
jgi:integrase